MITSSRNQIQPTSFDASSDASLMRTKVCSQCGGNGYMKTTPNCYHTCLQCLGRGFLKATS